MVRVIPAIALFFLIFPGTLLSKNFTKENNPKSISIKPLSGGINTLSDCFININAGFDIITCEGTSVQLNAEISDPFTEIFWVSMSGHGEFSDPTIINPVFTPGQEDYGSTISLQLTVFDEDTECEAVDFLDLTIYRIPVVDAGEDITICNGQTIDLNGFVNEEDYKDRMGGRYRFIRKHFFIGNHLSANSS